jgi:hypothetical protein
MATPKASKPKPAPPRPVFIMSYDEVRRDKATPDEIRDFAAGEMNGNTKLVHVDFDDDGDMATTPLTKEQVDALVLQLDADQIIRLGDICEDLLKIAKSAKKFSGVRFLISPLIIDAERLPYAERIVLEFASRHSEVTVERTSPPTDPKRKQFTPSLRVALGYTTLISVDWAMREVNTEEAIEKEIIEVTNERVMSDTELAAIARASGGF